MLFQLIRVAILRLESGMLAASAERFVPDEAKDLCRAAMQHLSMDGVRAPFTMVAPPRATD
eukprot:4197167-Alexandrium_andersonii.AAC.1